MKITFIDHSGFLVELEQSILLFDYYKGEIGMLPSHKDLYVFVSHKHQDHFNPEIFKLFRDRENVTFIMSKDTKMNEKYMKRKGIAENLWSKIFFIGKGVTESYGNVKVETFHSTDEGVAFAVEVGGKRIYHAGDLNWWSWSGETDEYNRVMEMDYKEQIDKIAGCKFDIAFVPLDPRLEEKATWGMGYFCEKVSVDYIIPMHMWGEFAWLSKAKKSIELSKYQDKIMDIKHTNQLIEI